MSRRPPSVVWPAPFACPACGREPDEDDGFAADEERGTPVCRHTCPIERGGCGEEWAYWPEGRPAVGEWVGGA